MATRFLLTNSGPAAVNPAFDGGWEQTGQADRVRMLTKQDQSSFQALANGTSITVPITTTQDILCRQFVSDPYPATQWLGTVSLVIRVFENALTNNVTLAVVVKICDQSGGNLRTLFSTFGTDTEFAASGSDATRIVNAQALSTTTGQVGDRLVVEVGGHATGPTAAGSYTMRFGNNAASDFALTSALTTDLNPWVEISQTLHEDRFNNYQSIRADDGISVGDRVR